MGRLIFLLILLLIPSLASAQDLTPGSYRIEYGGIYKLLVDKSTSLFKAAWLDQNELLFESGQMTYCEMIRSNRDIKLSISEWRNGMPWYHRRWWDSFPEDKGGAPEKPTVFYKGKTRIIADLGLFYFTNELGLKWRGVELAVDFKSRSPITVGVGGHVEAPRSGWKFRAYPNILISTKELFSNPLKTVRRVDLSIGGLHTVRGRDIVEAVFQIWHDLEESSWFFGAQIQLLRW